VEKLKVGVQEREVAQGQKKGEAGDKEEGQSEGDETQQSDCTMAAGESLEHRVIARIRRATAYRVDYSDNADLGDYESD
jgi:hypothetical protein